MSDFRIIQGDALEVLRSLPSESVHSAADLRGCATTQRGTHRGHRMSRPTLVHQRFRLVTGGATRWVLLTRRWAIKVPSLHSWKNFLWGLLANMQECEFSGADLRPDRHKLCPVTFHLPWGFLVVMPRAVEMSEAEFSRFDYEAFVMNGDNNWMVPVEAKSCSFGWLNGKVVAIDYGS